jgi:hypothetical protein
LIPRAGEGVEFADHPSLAIVVGFVIHGVGEYGRRSARLDQRSQVLRVVSHAKGREVQPHSAIVARSGKYSGSQAHQSRK